METENKVHELLGKIKSSKDPNYTLYHHLQRLYQVKLEMNDDQKFLDLFEDISLRLKIEGKYTLEPTVDKTVIFYLEQFCKNIAQKKPLILPLMKTDTDVPEPFGPVGGVLDYYTIFQTLEWVGLSIGSKESYMLTTSLRNFVAKKGLKGLKFWGKIYGSKKDYFIAECPDAEAAGGESPDPDMEPRGSGVNKNVYYVTSDLTQDWIELGDARPVHIKAAREIRYLFTGELDTKIVTNPHFPGLERDYLRCQIARIVQSTTIIPGGMFRPTQDNPIAFEPIDEAKPLKVKDLIYLNNWVHSLPHILNQGRITHKEIEPPQNHPNPDKFKEEYIASDPFDKILKPISEDKPLTSSFPNIKIPSWKIQFLYDDKIYTNPNLPINPEKDTTSNYTIIVIRCLRWPGLHVIRYKNENYHLYFGWGHKFIDTNMGERFVYEKFPTILGDPEELKTASEPNEPKEVPVANDNQQNPDNQ